MFEKLRYLEKDRQADRFKFKRKNLIVAGDLSGKEIEENNRMEKTRDIFKKIRATKGTFHAKIGTIKDRNGMDPPEAEDIKKR